MHRILDILEEEERIEEERNQARDREQRQEELERRKANAKVELDQLKAAKEMQKKMGKALLKNMADVRELEEKERARQEREDLEKEEARRSRKPRKIVSWAELPKQVKSSIHTDEDEDRDGDDARAKDGTRPSGRPPMRPNVVERFPIRSGASSPPPPVPMGDSDDESDPPSPGSSHSDPGEGTNSDGVPLPRPEYALSDGSEDEDELDDDQGLEDGFDIDAMQHQREIALAYFDKRNAIGTDAAHAMSAHSHDRVGEDEWEQEASPVFVASAGLT
jgi:hypothetical protein